jgi:hypothetical protein
MKYALVATVVMIIVSLVLMFLLLADIIKDLWF